MKKIEINGTEISVYDSLFEYVDDADITDYDLHPGINAVKPIDDPNFYRPSLDDLSEEIADYYLDNDLEYVNWGEKEISAIPRSEINDTFYVFGRGDGSWDSSYGWIATLADAEEPNIEFAEDIEDVDMAIKYIENHLEGEYPIPECVDEVISDDSEIDIHEENVRYVIQRLIAEDIPVTRDILKQFIAVDAYFDLLTWDNSIGKGADPEFQKWISKNYDVSPDDVHDWIDEHRDSIHEYEDLYLEYLDSIGDCIYITGCKRCNQYAPIHHD